jgi:hypothetical protein
LPLPKKRYLKLSQKKFIKNNEIMPKVKVNIDSYTLVPTLKQIIEKNANEPIVFQ